MTERCACVHLDVPRRTFALEGSTDHYAPDRSVLAEQVTLEVELDFERREVSGTCTTVVRAVREVDHLAFDAVDLDVDEATVNGKKVSVGNDGNALRLRLAAPLAEGEKAEVVIAYRARPERGLYFWGPDAGYPDRPVQAWTQGQDEDSRHWFPCLDTPSQRASTDVTASFPAHMLMLSNGAKVSDEVKGERRRTRYRLDFPHPPYLVTLAVGEFEEATDSCGPTQLRYLFPKGRKDDALRCVARTPEMMRLFEDLTGQSYPYGTYAQVFVTEFIFGGMENTGATTLSDTVLHDERAHLDYSAENLVAHELAHQWFGDLVTCREWPHGWLNEGFATYGEVLWKEHALGPDEADQQRQEDLDAYLGEAAHRYARPIVARRYEAPIELFDRHLYEKGGLVLHELRRRLGEGPFRKALRHYVAKHRGGSVETVDFARAVEEATGRNLDRFFDQYVYSPGHPKLEVKVRYDAEKKWVSLSVKQTQKTKDNGWPLFALPLEVRVKCPSGETTHQLELAELEHRFHLACPEEPSQVVIDPRRSVLGVLDVDKPSGLWLAELRGAPEAPARVQAALALDKEPSAKGIRALGAALLEDRFWGVQAACASSLARLRTPSAKKALLDGLKVTHPKARRAVVFSLGAFRDDDEVQAALERVCRKGDRSYFVEGEAARSLGRTRAKAALPLLEELTHKRSFQEAIAVGAVDGLAALRLGEAFGPLEALTRYGQPPHLRKAAVVALARLAEPADKKHRAVDVLTELLRDPLFRVQQGALEGAVVLDDRRMIGPLERTPFTDGRSRRQAKEVVRALRQDESRGRELSSLRDDVDKLRAELRALSEKVGQAKKPAKPKRPKPRRGR